MNYQIRDTSERHIQSFIPKNETLMTGATNVRKKVEKIPYSRLWSLILCG